MQLKHTLLPYTKINSKWLKQLNIRQDPVKLLEGIIHKTFSDINCTHAFLVFQANRNESKNKWDLIKLINHKQNKIQPREWDRIFSNDATDKGLIFKTYKQLIQLNKKTNNQIKKWAKDFNGHFSKEEIQMATSK